MQQSKLQEIKSRYSIFGNNSLLHNAIEQAVRVAQTNFSVLIRGESGVGKDIISKIIHQNSDRKHNPYVAVNCGAIPEGTVDSELFGHEKGSFTGAVASRKGYFEQANKGTIFLDEIGDLPHSSQAKLLRLLENGEYIKVGSSTPQKTDTRVVAATHVNLNQSITEGKFREDLFYRLNVVEIYLPPLRERKGDIPILAMKFLRDFSDTYKSPEMTLLPAAIETLQSYDWPGNIRELKNFIERLAILETKTTLDRNDILPYLDAIRTVNLPKVIPSSSEPTTDFSSEREIMYKVLFDMKNELNEVKSILNQVIRSNNQEDLYREHANLFTNQDISGTQMLKQYNPTKAEPEFHDLPNEIEPLQVDATEDIIDIQERENLSLQDMEIDLIKKALHKHHGKRRLAANDLGISERTLYRKINEYNIQ